MMRVKAGVSNDKEPFRLLNILYSISSISIFLAKVLFLFCLNYDFFIENIVHHRFCGVLKDLVEL